MPAFVTETGRLVYSNLEEAGRIRFTYILEDGEAVFGTNVINESIDITIVLTPTVSESHLNHGHPVYGDTPDVVLLLSPEVADQVPALPMQDAPTVTIAFSITALDSMAFIRENPRDTWYWNATENDIFALIQGEARSTWRWSAIIAVEQESIHSSWAWSARAVGDLIYPGISSPQIVGSRVTDEVVLNR